MSAKKNVRNLSVEEMQKLAGGMGLHGTLFSEREIPRMKRFFKRVPGRNSALKGRH